MPAFFKRDAQSAPSVVKPSTIGSNTCVESWEFMSLNSFAQQALFDTAQVKLLQSRIVAMSGSAKVNVCKI